MTPRSRVPLIVTVVALAPLLVLGASDPPRAFAQVPECAGLPAGAQLPDLRTVIPQHLNLVNPQQRELLRFSNGIANLGQGPLELFPLGEDRNSLNDAVQNVYDASTNLGALVCQRPLTGAFLFHEEHNHWHLNDVALFEVRHAAPGDDGTGGQWGPVHGASLKVSFCLLDLVPINDSKPKFRVYWDCFGVQGISVDWVDQYHHSTEGQDVDITGAPPGVYYLVSLANPVGVFLESNAANNLAWASFELRRDSQGNPKITEISHSPCAGALCGYTTNR